MYTQAASLASWLLLVGPAMAVIMDVYPKGQVAGGQLLPGEDNVDWCYYACVERVECAGFDFNNAEKTCWLHANDTECGAIDYNANVDHYRLIRCSDRSVSSKPSTYTPATVATTTPATKPTQSYASRLDHVAMLSSNGAYVKVYFNTYLKGGTRVKSVHDVNTCYITCLSNSKCQAIDFNSVQPECWHHYDSTACDYPYIKVGSTHFRLNHCTGPSSQSTVKPTPKGSTAAYVTSDDGEIKDMLFNMLPRGGYLVTAIDDLNSCDLVCRRYTSCQGFAFHSKKKECWLYTNDNVCSSPRVEDGCTAFRKVSCKNNDGSTTPSSSQSTSSRSVYSAGTVEKTTPPTTLVPTTASTQSRFDADVRVFINHHVKGGNRAKGANDVNMCHSLCKSDSKCHGFDFDSTLKLCWHHTYGTECNNLQPLEHTTHYSLYDCNKANGHSFKYRHRVPTFRGVYFDTHMHGATYFKHATYIQNCYWACVKNSLCTAMGFDSLHSTCWLHSADTCANAVGKRNCTLVRVRECGHRATTIEQTSRPSFTVPKTPVATITSLKSTSPPPTTTISTTAATSITTKVILPTIRVVSAPAEVTRIRLFFNSHAFGASRRRGVYDVNTCFEQCKAKKTCVAFDFDNHYKVCWFHSRYTACTQLYPKAHTVHYSMLDCSKGHYRPSTVPHGPSPDVGAVFFNAHVPGGQYLQKVKKIIDCVYACEARDDCVAVDFDSNHHSCWLHHNATVCAYSVSQRSNITHIPVRQSCYNVDINPTTTAAPTTTTTTTTTSAPTTTTTQATTTTTKPTTTTTKPTTTTTQTTTTTTTAAPTTTTTKATTTTTRAPKLLSTTVLYFDAHVRGSIYISNIFDVGDCSIYCHGIDTCIGYTFDSLYNACWITTDVRRCADVTHKRNCTHHRVRECAGQVPTNPNRYTATVSLVTLISFNTHMRKGYRHTGVSDANACYADCVSHERCNAFDFDSLHNTCWLHDEDGACSPMITKRNCTTYRITKCVTTATPSPPTVRPPITRPSTTTAAPTTRTTTQPTTTTQTTQPTTSTTQTTTTTTQPTTTTTQPTTTTTQATTTTRPRTTTQTTTTTTQQAATTTRPRTTTQTTTQQGTTTRPRTTTQTTTTQQATTTRPRTTTQTTTTQQTTTRTTTTQATAVAAPVSPAGRRPIKDVFFHQHIPGGTFMFDISDVPSCANECVSNSSCIGFTFDSQHRTCWQIAEQPKCSNVRPKRNCTHYRIDCDPTARQGGNAPATVRVHHTLFNFQLHHGYRIPNIYDVNTCAASCEEHAHCTGFDFDDLHHTCWLHDEDSSCATPVHKVNCTHYSLQLCPAFTIPQPATMRPTVKPTIATPATAKPTKATAKPSPATPAPATKPTKNNKVPHKFNTPSIRAVYINTQGRHDALLSKIFDINTCYQACANRSTCVSMTFDSLYHTCWLSESSYHCASLAPKKNCTHIIVRQCQSRIKSRPDFHYAQIKEVVFNANAGSGRQQENIYDVNTCYQKCVNHGGCRGFDFDSLHSTCWFHSDTSVCGTARVKTNCTHFRLKHCKTSGVTPASTDVFGGQFNADQQLETLLQRYETAHYGMHVNGARSVFRDVSRKYCLQHCLADVTCLAVDYSYINRSCHVHGVSSFCGKLQPAPYFSHYKRTKCVSYSARDRYHRRDTTSRRPINKNRY